MDEIRPYEKLIFYQNICEIRKMIVPIAERLPQKHFRLASQMRDAARSAKQNIREGYRKGSAGEFGRSIRISQGSLEELSGDIEDCLFDKLITKEEFDNFTKLYKSAMYLSNQYLFSLYKLEKAGKWKIPGEKFRK